MLKRKGFIVPRFTNQNGANAPGTQQQQQQLTPSVPGLGTLSGDRSELRETTTSEDLSAKKTKVQVERDKENLPLEKPSVGHQAVFKPPSNGFKLPSSSMATGHVNIHRGYPAAPAPAPPQEELADSKYYTVLYIKKDQFNKKKATKAYSDGILEVGAIKSTLFERSGKSVCVAKVRRFTSKSCSKQGYGRQQGVKGNGDEDEDEDEAAEMRFEIGSFIAEVDQEISADSFKSGHAFLKSELLDQSLQSYASLTKKAPVKAFKSLVSKDQLGGSEQPAAAVRGLHDPLAENALLLNADQWNAGKGLLANGRGVCPVVVDPFLTRHLRPHQREGVQFMYSCCLGMKDERFNGCILADEMGLGKTLQVIALIWTLLRQGTENKAVCSKAIVVVPASLVNNWAKEVKKWLGDERMTTMTLQQSTRNEGNEGKERILAFRHGTVCRIMITSYETLRKHARDLEGVGDLLICDEAHRLKCVSGSKTLDELIQLGYPRRVLLTGTPVQNHHLSGLYKLKCVSGSKTLDALIQLGCPRRVLLTGTPVQNNLDEFYALLSFVAPNLLGTASLFKRVYSDPISKSRDREATEAEKEIGAARASELQSKLAFLVLRRTAAEHLAKHLPRLSQYVVFCRPTSSQLKLYRHVLKNSNADENILATITALRKLCNAPSLLLADTAHQPKPATTSSVPGKGSSRPASEQLPGNGRPASGQLPPPNGDDATDLEEVIVTGGGGSVEAAAGGVSALLKGAPAVDLHPIHSSGKLACLHALLQAIVKSGERCVVVSQSTAALDLIQQVACHQNGWVLC
eukprot:gene2367-8676_t